MIRQSSWSPSNINITTCNVGQDLDFLVNKVVQDHQVYLLIDLMLIFKIFNSPPSLNSPEYLQELLLWHLFHIQNSLTGAMK